MEALFDPTVTSSFAATNRPSLFELLAQDQLRSLLQPAARYLLAVSSLHIRLSSCLTNVDPNEKSADSAVTRTGPLFVFPIPGGRFLDAGKLDARPSLSTVPHPSLEQARRNLLPRPLLHRTLPSPHSQFVRGLFSFFLCCRIFSSPFLSAL